MRDACKVLVCCDCGVEFKTTDSKDYQCYKCWREWHEENYPDCDDCDLWDDTVDWC